MDDNQPSVITVRDDEGRLHFTSPHSDIAKRAAEREAAEAAQVPEPPRGGAGSGVDAWRDYASRAGIEIDDTMNRDDIIAAVELAREEADAAEPSESGDDRDAGTSDRGSSVGQREARDSDSSA